MVVVANGKKMMTDARCMYWHEFKHPSIEFVSDLRFLDVLGYDLILGLDWLSQLGPMRVY